MKVMYTLMHPKDNVLMVGEVYEVINKEYEPKYDVWWYELKGVKGEWYAGAFVIVEDETVSFKAN